MGVHPPAQPKPMPESSPIKPSPVRNVLNVVLGNLRFPAWYPSFYPEDLVGKECKDLYVCQRCFSYSKELAPYLSHRKLCPAKDEELPGRLIYAKAPYAIYEVDGEENKLFTQNLSLFAKLFLDNKSVFFDVASFNYYILVQGACPGPRAHSTYVGFFSKEKMSWDNNNLACILVFPPWQRQGLGKILMGASYELSRREGRVGGPEKPLSELGRRGYLRFWQARVARELLDFKGKGTVTVEELAARCWMLAEDVMVALKEMGILEVRKKSDVVGVCKSGVREWVGAKHVDMAPPVDRGCFLEEWATEGENEEN